MGTDDGRPPHVMSIGHHDGIRGIADGNWAYIAQSYGASIHEIDAAPMHTRSSGCRRRRRQLSAMPATSSPIPPT